MDNTQTPQNETNNVPEPTPAAPTPPPDPLPTAGESVTPTPPTPAVEPAKPVATAPVTDTPTAKPTQVRVSRKSPLKLLLVVVVLAVLVGAGAWAWHAHSSKPTAVTTVKNVPLLRVGTEEGPIGKAYIFPNAETTSITEDIDSQIFEGLVGYEGQKIVPVLATSWTNPNKDTWVFQLAKNVTFQNGQTMTAGDVVTSLNADLQSEAWGSYLSTISSVSATGTNEVTVKTAQPDALLLGRLAYGFIYKQDAQGNSSGTGPYVLDTNKPDTATNLSLKAYAGYHGGVPKTKEISYIAYNDPSSAEKAFKAKQIDTYQDISSKATKTSLTSLPGVQSSSYSEPGSYGLNLNIARKNGVMAKLQVRQAVAYALDRASYIKDLGSPSEPTQQIVPKSVVGYDASATFSSFDLAKSKQLQTAAGYPNGVPITYVYIKGLQTDGPIIVKQLQAAGFQVTVDAPTSPDQTIPILEGGNYDIFGISEFSDFNDATDIFDQLLDSKDSQFPLYNNPQFDAMVTAAEQEFDPAAHIQKVQAINKYVADNVLWIPLRTSVQTVYVQGGYQVIPNFSQAFTSVAYWKVGQAVTTTTK